MYKAMTSNRTTIAALVVLVLLASATALYVGFGAPSFQDDEADNEICFYFQSNSADLKVVMAMVARVIANERGFPDDKRFIEQGEFASRLTCGLVVRMAMLRESTGRIAWSYTLGVHDRADRIPKEVVIAFELGTSRPLLPDDRVTPSFPIVRAMLEDFSAVDNILNES